VGQSIPGLAIRARRRGRAEALRWVALGRRGPDVARLMGLSPRTVEKHLAGAYAKLGVAGASEAAATAWAAVGVACLADGALRSLTPFSRIGANPPQVDRF
jgi:DNA-binding CsgD family transcriptional regulator